MSFFPRATDDVGALSGAVKSLVAEGVDLSEIKRRATSAGWTAQGVNRALREAGIRQRGERADTGMIRSPMSSADEADRILRHYPDLAAALSFLERVGKAIKSKFN